MMIRHPTNYPGPGPGHQAHYDHYDYGQAGAMQHFRSQVSYQFQLKSVSNIVCHPLSWSVIQCDKTHTVHY